MRTVPHIVWTLILLGAVCIAATLSGVPLLWVGLIGAVMLVRGVMGVADADQKTRFDPPPGATNKPE